MVSCPSVHLSEVSLRKLALTRTSDPIRPSRLGPNPNRSTRQVFFKLALTVLRTLSDARGWVLTITDSQGLVLTLTDPGNCVLTLTDP